MTEPILYRYRPRDGAFLAGLPQRDLTATDLASIPSWDLRDGVASGLYVPVAETEPTDNVSTEAPPVAETEPENRRARR